MLDVTGLAVLADQQRSGIGAALVEGVLREEFLLDGRYVDDLFMARALDAD